MSLTLEVPGVVSCRSDPSDSGPKCIRISVSVPMAKYIMIAQEVDSPVSWNICIDF